MQKRIRVVYQLNELAYSGTTKAIYSIIENLDRSRFEVFLFYKSDFGKFRYWRYKLASFFSKKAKTRYTEFFVTAVARLPEFTALLGADHIFRGNWNEFEEVIQRIKPDILHLSRGDAEDWFTDKIDWLPKNLAIIETSIFGQPSNENYLKRLDRVFLISDWIKSKTPWAEKIGQSVYLPIMKPKTTSNLRKELGIAEDEIVVGRISRPGMDSGKEVLQILASVPGKFRFVNLGGGELVHKEAKSNSNIICLSATTDEMYLSKFYNTLDILLHYRKEGETFGMSIADAMIHGKPVVSHKSFLDNSQIELIAPDSECPCGFIVEENDFKTHGEKIGLLIRDKELRKTLGQNAKARSEQHFTAQVVAKKVEEQYVQLLKEKQHVLI